MQRYESPRFICTQHAFQPPMARCAAQVARACPIQIIRLLLLPPTPHAPCPRRPSPDTASTFALAQGQQEGDKRRARAQGQGRAQVPDAAPTPVNHTSRTRQALRRGLPLRCYFGTHCRSLFILSHYRNTGGVVFCSGHCHWGTLEYRDSSPILAFLCSQRSTPCPRSPNLGRTAVILRASKPSKRHRLVEAKRLCANAALVPRGTDAHDLHTGPIPPPDKGSVWFCSTGVFLRRSVTKDYI